ncbi:MAG: NAD(P)-dependent oxidoreductase [Actinomycetota bacterium]
MSAKRAVITGAAGCIGRAFTDALTKDGYEVTGIDLRSGPGIVAGDISEPGEWTKAIDGADLVVHAAAVVGELGELSAYWKINVDGTRNVLDAASNGRAGRVLHLSSIVVHGSDFADGVDETATVRMTGNPYTDTKTASEHQALLAAASGRAQVTIVRPGDVYGPGSVPWTLRPVEMMKRKVFTLVDHGRGVLSPTYVDDLVAGSMVVATHADTVGHVFHVTGGKGVRAADFFGYYARMLGIRLRSVPSKAMYVVAPAAKVARMVGKKLPFTPDTIEYITHPGTYSIKKIDAMTGWRPAVTLDDGMARTEAWLRAEKLIP